VGLGSIVAVGDGVGSAVALAVGVGVMVGALGVGCSGAAPEHAASKAGIMIAASRHRMTQVLARV
jgi:hypothetical protein